MKPNGLNACLRSGCRLPSFGVYLLFSMLLVSCAAITPGGTDDSIVGQWDGTGMLPNSRAVFEKEGSFRVIDTWDAKHGFFSGTWRRGNGKYVLDAVQDGAKLVLTGKIDSEGKLIIPMTKDPDGPAFVFQRQGGKPPAAEPASNPPQGEWRYAYTSKSSIPACSPCPFDTMTFQDGGKVLLKSSAAGVTFDKLCKISKKLISVPTGRSEMPSLDFRYRWEDKGKRLVLAPGLSGHDFMGDIEWTFLQPDQFLPLDLGEGTWVGNLPEQQGWSEEMQFGGDGRYSRKVVTKDGRLVHQNNAQKVDYYRLWKAPFGNAVTIVTFDQEMSSQLSQIFQYEKKGTELVLLPVELTERGALKVHPEGNYRLRLKAK